MRPWHTHTERRCGIDIFRSNQKVSCLGLSYNKPLLPQDCPEYKRVAFHQLRDALTGERGTATAELHTATPRAVLMKWG